MCQNCVEYFSDPMSWYGLIPAKAHKTFDVLSKVTAPTEIEIELSAKKHRRKQNNKVMEDFFNTIAHRILVFSKDTNKLLNLPPIEDVRRFIHDPDFEDDSKPFELSGEQRKAYQRIVNELSRDMIGVDAKKIKAVTLQDLPIYQYHMLTQFSATIPLTMQDIVNELPIEQQQLIYGTQIVPNLQDAYLDAAIKDGGKRIKLELGKKYIDTVIESLEMIAKEHKTAYQAATYLYKEAQEGKLWYWRRLARSESTLAINSAFRAQSEASNVQFEVWSAAADACPICSAFDGMMWRLGDGPQPVSSTHPHCLCLRFPRFTQGDRIIQGRWDRAEPYNSPYQPEEITAWLNIPRVMI